MYHPLSYTFYKKERQRERETKKEREKERKKERKKERDAASQYTYFAECLVFSLGLVQIQ